MKKILNIIIIALCLSLLFCDKNNYSEKMPELGELSDLLVIADSCILAYPAEALPQRVVDIAISNESIYVIGVAPNYPLVKFYNDGKFDKIISAKGSGPGEIMGQQSFKIATHDSLLVICDIEFNRLLLFKNDEFYIEKSFLDNASEILNVKLTDVEISENNDIVITCYGNASHHIAVLNDQLELKEKRYPLPHSADLIRILGYPFYFGIQKVEDHFVSNFVYPPNILKFKYSAQFELLDDYSKLKFNNFQIVDSTISLSDVMNNSNVDLRKIFESFSKIYWVTELGEYLFGAYEYSKDEFRNVGGMKLRDKGYQLFVMKNGTVIEERPIAPKHIREIIPYNNQLIMHSFVKREGDINISLLFLELNNNNIF